MGIFKSVRKVFSRKPKELGAYGLEIPPEVRRYSRKLDHPNPEVRKRAAESLGETGLIVAVPYLAKALHDQDKAVRRMAARGLGSIPHESAVPPLGTALDDPEPVVRNEAVDSLYEWGHIDAVPYLKKALRDASVSLSATHGLLKIGRRIQGKEVKGKEARLLQQVIPKINEEKPKIAEPVLRAVLHGEANLAEVDAYVKWLRFLDHAHADWVRGYQLYGREAKEEAAQHALVRSDLLNVSVALEEPLRRRVVAFLVKASKKKGYTRLATMEALGIFGHELAIPSLTAALLNEDKETRNFAAALLGRIALTLQWKEVKRPKSKMLQYLGRYYLVNEEPEVIRRSYLAALQGRLQKKNARLYIKQLRALRGNLK